MSEGKASALHKQASRIESSEPLKALELLKEATNESPKGLTVHNYVIDSIIRIGIINELWDEAIEGCKLGIKLKPHSKEHYSLEAKACHLDKAGKSIEATETRYKRDTLRGEYFLTARYYGDRFTQLGANDRAWGLYNKAITLAALENQSPHSVRATMAKLLLSEGKQKQAIQQIFLGIEEAERLSKKGAPKSLSTLLRRALRKLDIKDSTISEELVSECKAHGNKKAMRKLRIILGENPKEEKSNMVKNIFGFRKKK